MPDQAVHLLLQEFRSFRDNEFRQFRDEINSWRQETVERVATLEAHDKDISGNGQPGRMVNAEKKITLHDRVIWIGYGLLLSLQAAAFLMIHWPF